MAGFEAALASGITNLWSTSENIYQQKKQNEWNHKMWKEQAVYNSPVQQALRYRAAGLNPAYAMEKGGLDGGNLSNASTGVNPSPVDFSPTSQAIMKVPELSLIEARQKAEINKMNSETANQDIRNRFEAAQQSAQLWEKASKVGLNSRMGQMYAEQARLLAQQANMYNEEAQSRIRSNTASAKKMEAEESGQRLMNAYQTIINKYAPKQQEALLSQLAAQKEELLAAAYEHNEAALNHAADTALKGVDKDTKKALKPWIIDKAVNEANESYWNSEKVGRSYLLGDDIGRRTPAMDLNGKTYSSPNKTYRYKGSRTRGR